MFNMAIETIKEWIVNSAVYLNILFYWICCISGTVSIIYYVLSKDNRGKQFTIKCIVLYMSVQIILGAWK